MVHPSFARLSEQAQNLVPVIELELGKVWDARDRKVGAKQLYFVEPVEVFEELRAYFAKVGWKLVAWDCYSQGLRSPGGFFTADPDGGREATLIGRTYTEHLRIYPIEETP